MWERIKYFVMHPLRFVTAIVTKLPYFKFISETKDYQCHISFNAWFLQKILNLGGNRNVYWPVHFTSKVYDSNKILVGIDAYPGYMGGCYIQGLGGIKIGDYTQIAPNVVIVSANHDVYDSRKHQLGEVEIGKYCWIGAGAKIMPGVKLGDWTIVGAGAVVTKSFTEGSCIIAGVPAVEIKQLEKGKCIPFNNSKAYNGFIRSDKFNTYRKKHLKI